MQYSDQKLMRVSSSASSLSFQSLPLVSLTPKPCPSPDLERSYTGSGSSFIPSSFVSLEHGQAASALAGPVVSSDSPLECLISALDGTAKVFPVLSLINDKHSPSLLLAVVGMNAWTQSLVGLSDDNIGCTQHACENDDLNFSYDYLLISGPSSVPMVPSPSAINAMNVCQPSSLSWPSLQKQTQGDDRAAVLLSGGARQQSIGTGVFLPRRTGTPFEPRKKPAGPNVFLPARVVQALNLNVDELNFNPRSQGIYHYENGGYMLNDRIKKNYPGALATTTSESKLPQEWTY